MLHHKKPAQKGYRERERDLHVPLDVVEQLALQAEALAQETALLQRRGPDQAGRRPVGADPPGGVSEEGRVDGGFLARRVDPVLLEAGDALGGARAEGLHLLPARVHDVGGGVESLPQLVAEDRDAPEEHGGGRVLRGEEARQRGDVGRDHAGHVLHAGEQHDVGVGQAEQGLLLPRRGEQRVDPAVHVGAEAEARSLDRPARVQAEEQGQRQVEEDVLRVRVRHGPGRAPQAGDALLEHRREGPGQRAAGLGQRQVDGVPQVGQQAVVRRVGDGQHQEPQPLGAGGRGGAGRHEVGVDLPLGHVYGDPPGSGEQVQRLHLAVQPAAPRDERWLFLSGCDDGLTVPLKHGRGNQLHVPPVVQPVDRQGASVVLEGC